MKDYQVKYSIWDYDNERSVYVKNAKSMNQAKDKAIEMVHDMGYPYEDINILSLTVI